MPALHLAVKNIYEIQGTQFQMLTRFNAALIQGEEGLELISQPQQGMLATRWHTSGDFDNFSQIRPEVFCLELETLI